MRLDFQGGVQHMMIWMFVLHSLSGIESSSGTSSVLDVWVWMWGVESKRDWVPSTHKLWTLPGLCASRFSFAHSRRSMTTLSVYYSPKEASWGDFFNITMCWADKSLGGTPNRNTQIPHPVSILLAPEHNESMEHNNMSGIRLWSSLFSK